MVFSTSRSKSVQILDDELDDQENLYQSFEAQSRSRSISTMSETSVTREADFVIKTKGIIGIIENIPLSIKLLFMTILSISGFLTLASISIARSSYQVNNKTNDLLFISLYEAAMYGIGGLRDERFIALSTSQGYSSFSDFSNYVSLTNRLLEKADVNLTQHKQFTNQTTNLEKIRQDPRKYSVAFIINVYSEIIEEVFQINIENFGDMPTPMFYYTFMFTESSLISTLSANASYTRSFKNLRNDDLYLLVTVYGSNAGVHSDYLKVLSRSNSGLSAILDQYSEYTIQSAYLLDQITHITNSTEMTALYESEAGSRIFAGYINQTRMMETDVFFLQLNSSAKELKSEYNTLILFSVSSVVLFLVVMLSHIIFSRTITGPWQRLNRLQENTIQKFVPRMFLGMLGCNTISDATLGKNRCEDVTMMLVVISKSPNEIGLGDINHRNLQALSDLNDFLNLVCPSIRKYNGFIDRYNHDGFSAIFKSSNNAARAALEMTLLEIQSKIKFQVSLHYSKVLVGVVGENQRLDGAIISNEVQFNKTCIDRVCSKLNVQVVCSILDQDRFNAAFHRYLCDVTNKISGVTYKVHQLFSYDKCKIDTITLFNDATSLFNDKLYYDARDLFKKIINLDPDDSVAFVFLELCEWSIKECEKALFRMDTLAFLQIDDLREPLHEYCIKELSTENIHLFEICVRFREIEDEGVRWSVANNVYNTYCDTDAPQLVNVTDKIKDRVKQQLNQNKAGVGLLDELKMQMVINLNDTIKRFQDTVRCKRGFMSLHAKDWQPHI
ncbi:hypothetical protein AKO1_007545 [Acrasis kona]|uniref:RGS domain-containing protein n=1 Tax=Acrasis kona TaxID=1008807 RepID=A0AAW2YRP7_9EUKA